jgi:probable selenium-dependent hydroxylase accessory protein YqeC
VSVTLKQAFDIEQGEVISLVGAGGKTTLMFALARDLAATGAAVITTTTTRIFEPSASETFLLLERDEERIIELLLRELHSHRHITLGTERFLSEGKVKGVSPELVTVLADLEQVSYVIVEADGAARKPVKAPNATEPVIPQNTSLVIPVVGIEALGRRLTEDNAFRPEIISRLTGLQLGRIISADVVATLMTHPEGIIKGSPAHARIVPLINKMDLDKGLSKSEDLASKILDKRHPQIERVVLGRVQFKEPVVRIVRAAEKAA